MGVPRWQTFQASVLPPIKYTWMHGSMPKVQRKVYCRGLLLGLSRKRAIVYLYVLSVFFFFNLFD